MNTSYNKKDTEVKASSVQITKLYIACQKLLRGDLTIQNSLLHYINLVCKTEDEEVDLVFVDELVKDDVDINCIDEIGENLLFKVRKVYSGFD